MLLDFLVSLLKSENDEVSVHNIDLIVPLSYASLPDRLTNGTRESFVEALRYKKRFPNAVFAFINVGTSGFAKSEDREYELKRWCLAELPHVCAGVANSSIEEAEAIRVAIPAAWRILIICGEAHSAGARWIWEKIFPDATVIIRCMPYTCEYQEDHPFPIERYPWRWFFASLGRIVMLRLIGLQVRHIKHRAKPLSR